MNTFATLKAHVLRLIRELEQLAASAASGQIGKAFAEDQAQALTRDINDATDKLVRAAKEGDISPIDAAEIAAAVYKALAAVRAAKLGNGLATDRN
jgi:hypothetical protein